MRRAHRPAGYCRRGRDVLAGLTGALLAQQDDVATTGETVASAAYPY